MTQKEFNKACEMLPRKIVVAIRNLGSEIDNYFLNDKRTTKSEYKMAKKAVQDVIIETAGPFVKRCAEKIFELSIKKHPLIKIIHGHRK